MNLYLSRSMESPSIYKPCLEYHSSSEREIVLTCAWKEALTESRGCTLMSKVSYIFSCVLFFWTGTRRTHAGLPLYTAVRGRATTSSFTGNGAERGQREGILLFHLNILNGGYEEESICWFYIAEANNL